MSEKTLNNIRIINKHDTEANWLKATGFTPKQGELIVYDIDENYNYERIKIGDGVQNVNDLPFAVNRSFVVTVSRDAGNNTIVDKTYQEIYDAAKAGMHVYMVTGDTVYVDGNSMWPDTVLWLSYYSDYSVIFTHHDGSAEYEVEVDSDGGVSVYYSSSLPSKYSFGYEGMVLTVGENGEVNPADFPATIARASDVEEVKELVGDVSVSEQINTAAVNNQSDWSVNDETSPAYVKNRPFYENIIATAILSDTTFEFTDYGDYCAVEDGLDITLTEGCEYQLKIDDVIYTSVCGTFDGGIPYLGNLHVFNNTLEDTGESFVFFMEGTYFLCGTTEFSTGNHTIAISKSVREIKTVDEKYIPDTIARVSDIDEVKELVGDTSVSEQINTAAVNNQSDWSVNDETSPAYVKNRTHWEEYAEGTYTNEELSFSYSNAAKLYESDGIILDGNVYEPEVGSTVSFELNGSSYELTVFRDTDGYIAYGDTEADLIAGTGAYGFRVINWWTNRYNIQSLTEITTANVVLHYNYGVYHALDREKYLPTVPGYLDGLSIRFGSSTSTGNTSFAEGFGTEASGDFSHAAGMYTKALADRSFAIGDQTVAASYDQFVHGKYNVQDTEDVYAHIVGNGSQLNGRSNAHTLDWSGNAWFKGAIKIGGTGQDDETAKELATKEYVDSFVGGVTVAEQIAQAIQNNTPKITSITLPAASWAGDTNPWSQVVTVNGVTVNSKIDLQPTAVQIVELQNEEITLMLQNDDGVVTAWAIGNKPTKDYTMQVLITEVVRV